MNGGVLQFENHLAYNMAGEMPFFGVYPLTLRTHLDSQKLVDYFY